MNVKVKKSNAKTDKGAVSTAVSKILVSVLIIFSLSSFSQETGMLRGQIKSSDGTSVGFANVTAVRKTDAVTATGTVAGPDGVFSIKSPAPGIYILRVSAIGYETSETLPFAATGSSFEKDFGTITLKQNMSQLQEVKIESLRPTITQLPDRMVVKIEGTAMAAGNTAFTILTRMPGIFIDPDGNIQFNGRSGVTVMLDGKLTYLSAADLRNMLEAMPAENVKNIEIIANPPASFDAEGTAGVLNIILRKPTKEGMSGSLYSSYVHNYFDGALSYGGNINYKKGSWTSFLNVDRGTRTAGREATFTRVFYAPGSTTYFDQEATSDVELGGPPSVRAGTEWDITNKHTIGASAKFNRMEASDGFFTKTFIGEDRDNPSQFVQARNLNGETSDSYTANLYYKVKLDTLGTSFSTDLDYVRIANGTTGNFRNFFTNLESSEVTQDFLYAQTESGIDILSAKADYTRPIAKSHKIEAGAKASRVTSDNDARFYFNNGYLLLDPLRSNHFNYTEDILASYVSWSGNFNPKFSVKAGLRAENTASKGISYTTGEETKREYLSLFPSLFIHQQANGSYEINYSYSRRITRPNYGRLNPFRIYRDPYTWTNGNPQLRPQYTHSFSVSQTFKKVYSFTVSYDWDQDVMTEIPSLNVEDGTTTYTTGNVDDRHTVTAMALVPLKFAKWWDTQNTVALWHSRLSTEHENGYLVNEQLSFRFRSNHTFRLPAAIRIEANFQYQSASVNGLYRMAPMNRLDMAAKRSFLGKKLDVVLNANDIFRGWRFKWTTDINGNVNEFDQYMRHANIGLTVRYNFSSGTKVEEVNRSEVEEMKRAN